MVGDGQGHRTFPGALDWEKGNRVRKETKGTLAFPKAFPQSP